VTVSGSLRFIACHKHPVSGRLYFVRFNTGHICGPQSLPQLAVLTEPEQRLVIAHPAAALRDLSSHLNLPLHLFSLLGEFRLFLEVPARYAPLGVMPIYLAAIAGYKLPASFELPYLQREILRAAYEFLMG